MHTQTPNQELDASIHFLMATISRISLSTIRAKTLLGTRYKHTHGIIYRRKRVYKTRFLGETRIRPRREIREKSFEGGGGRDQCHPVRR